MDQATSPSSPVDPSPFTYVVGIDSGSQTCSFCVLKSDKSQVFADPCRPTALSLLKLYRSRASLRGSECRADCRPRCMRLSPRNYGLHTAQQLVNLAQHSGSLGVALSARSTSLKILCDQLEHTQANLLQLEQELENLMKTDTGAKGEASRSRIRWQDYCRAASGIGGRRSLCLLEPGSGRIRRILYMAVVRCIRLKDSAFGAYYHHLVARGRPRRAAMMAVMRKMLAVAYRLLKTQEAYGFFFNTLDSF